MTPTHEPPVQETFSRALAALWARDGIVLRDPETLASRVTASFAAGADGVSEASALMLSAGVGDRWNEILRRDRSAALASRIRPFVVEPVIDVLAGDGSVCRALSTLGVARLAATERIEDYRGEPALPPNIAFMPYSEVLDLSQFNASTALVSTVLHHEPDPIRLLDSLARAGIPRWIVIENCVTPDFSAAFHEFADRFFNTCLNRFGVHCGDQHRTLHEWVDLLCGYGTVDVVSDTFTVPGIPFTYSLLIVDLAGVSISACRSSGLS